MKFNRPSTSHLSKPLGPTPAMAARKALLRRIQRQELRKLQSLLPPTAIRHRSQEPDACQVIDQAIKYIDQLHSTILARVRSGSLPTGEY